MASFAIFSEPVASTWRANSQTRFVEIPIREQASVTYHDVETVGVLLLQLLPLGVWVLPVKLDVLVTCLELLRDIHLDALVRGNDDPHRAVELQQLGEDEARGARADDQRLYAHWCIELIHSVYGAGCGLDKGSLFVGQVVDLV